MVVPPTVLQPPFSTYRMLRHSGEIYGYFTKWLNALPDYGWLARGVDAVEAAGKKKEKRPATATVVTISSIGYRQPPQTVSLSSRRFPATITEPWKSHSSPIFFPPSTFILSLACSLFHQRDSSLLAFTFSRSLRVLPHRPAWPARRLFAGLGNLLPFLSSLVEIIRKMEVFLPWRKVRFVRRSRGLET